MVHALSPMLTLLVDNEFGVLIRVASQIRREGWNIRSLAVAETTDSKVSRITLSIDCFNETLPNVLNKLKRLQCVRSVTAYNPEIYVCRELAILRLSPDTWSKSTDLNAQIGAKLIEANHDSCIIEVCATSEDLTAYIDALLKIGNVVAARSGAITLEKEEI